MPRKKTKPDQTEVTEAPILSEVQIKLEPPDDYETPSTQGDSSYGDMQIKSEPEEYEYVLNGIEDASSDLNHNEFETSGSAGENYDNDADMSGLVPDTVGDLVDSTSDSEEFTAFRLESSSQDKIVWNTSVTEEEYEMYTGKKLDGPITKKMYEHFRYMKTKILYKDKFKCDMCTRAFPFRHELARHRLYHTGVKQHECEVCGKTFILKGQLTTHMLSHTRIRRFKCKYCPSTFLLGSHLRQHLPSHDPNLRLKCEHCNLTFTRKASLDRHVKRIHVDKEKMLLQLPNKAQQRQGIFSICQHCNQVLRSDKPGCACSRKDYCLICDTRLGNAKNLALHMKTFHTKRPDQVDEDKEDSAHSQVRITNGKVVSPNQDLEQNGTSIASSENTTTISTTEVSAPSIQPVQQPTRARIRKPQRSMQIKFKNYTGPKKNNSESSPKKIRKVMPKGLPATQATQKASSENTPLIQYINGPILNMAGNGFQPLQFITGNTLVPGGIQTVQQNGSSNGISNQLFCLVPVNFVRPDVIAPNNRTEVNNVNTYNNVVVVEPTKSESSKKKEIERVVTFKVELPKDEDPDLMEAVTSGIKIEPEENGRQESDTNSLVVYKVKEEDTSIQDGFCKALCIKQEPQDDSEMQSSQINSVNHSIPQNNVNNASNHCLNNTEVTPKASSNPEVSQAPTPNMSTSMANHTSAQPIECTLTEVSVDEGLSKSTKIVRPSKSKTGKVTLDSLFSNAIETNVSSA